MKRTNMKGFTCLIMFVAGCLGQVPNVSQSGIGNAPSGGRLDMPLPGSQNVPPLGSQNTPPVGIPTNTPPAGNPNIPTNTPPVGIPTNTPPAGIPNIPTNTPPVGIPNIPTNTPPVGIPNIPTNTPPVNLPTAPTGGQNDQDNTGGTGGTPSPIRGIQNVNRPCRRYDLQCVRYFFKDHSHCKNPYGKVPEPLYRAISNQFYPAFNLTVTNTNAYYTGFNRGRVEDLYVNRETDKVVLTIDFRDLRKASKDVFIRYHRRAREPIITYGYSSFEYKSLIVTVTIPQVDDLRLDKADIFGYSNTLPVIDIDPRLGESSDPVVARSFALLLTDLQTTATENLLTEAAFFAAVYIQNVICDFGLKLI